MKSKSLLLLAVAAGCGLVAMMGVQRMLAGNQDGEKVTVLVARTDIDAGVKLDETNVAFRSFAKETVPEGVVTTKAQFDERAPKSKVYAGQQIAVAQLGEKGVFGATITIPAGKRVITVPVNATMTHSGLMKAGDRVDVIVSFKMNRPKVGQVFRTKTFLEFIEVYSIDSEVAGNDHVEKAQATAKNVSLLVTPKQANLIKLAESKGQLHLALRSKLDAEVEDAGEISDAEFDRMAEMFDEKSEPAEDTTQVAEATPAPEPVAPAPEPTPAPEPVKIMKPAGPNFMQVMAERFAAAALHAASAPPPPKKTWKVEIYSGPDLKIHEVDLPEPAADALPEQDRQAALDPASVEVARRFMKGMLSPTMPPDGIALEQYPPKIRVE